MGELAINGGCKVVPSGLIKPWPQVTDADRQAVMAALDEAVPWRYPFPSTRALEHAWAQFVGTKYALACNSGTAALLTANRLTPPGTGRDGGRRTARISASVTTLESKHHPEEVHVPLAPAT